MWKRLKNYPEYEVSDYGELRRQGRILVPLKDSNGYRSYSLSKNGFVKRVLAHRIVAQQFIANPHNKPQVNHKNGIKHDNRVDNLEWMTCGENHSHAIKLGLKPPPPKYLKTDEHHRHAKAMLVYDLNGNLLRRYGCISTLARDFGVVVSAPYQSIKAGTVFQKKYRLQYEKTKEPNKESSNQQSRKSSIYEYG